MNLDRDIYVTSHPNISLSDTITSSSSIVVAKDPY